MSKIHYAITRLTAGGALFIRVRFHHAPLLTFTPPNNSDLFDFPSSSPRLSALPPPPPPFPIILRHARAITFDRRRQTTIRPDRLRNRTHCVRILASRIDGSVFRERSTRLRGIRGANGTCPTWEARPARLLDSRWGTHMLAFVPLRAGETKTSGSPSPWSSNEPRSPPGTHLSLAATTLVSSQSRATIFVSARRHVPLLTSLPFFPLSPRFYPRFSFRFVSSRARRWNQCSSTSSIILYLSSSSTRATSRFHLSLQGWNSGD